MQIINKPITIQDNAKEAIAWLESEYPRGIDLIYIDYRDSIEDPKKREEILQTPEEAYEIIDGNSWTGDAQYETINEIEKNYKNKIEAEELTEEVSEAMRDWCFEHDTSDPVKDLLKNTRDEYMYYDTGLSFESLEYGNDQDKDIIKRVKTIAKKLKIDYEKHAKGLRLMVDQAYYGGQLVVLFENNIGNFMTDAKYIEFYKNAEICLMDRGSGSGDHTKINETLLFEFKRENIHTDKGDNGYSYSGDVCGLVGGIMNDGVLTNKKDNLKVIKITTNEQRKEQREREARYIASWNNGKGKCTFLDMNMERHASTPYRNDYPCGSKCSICNTFWID